MGLLWETRWLTPPTLARYHVTICVSYFTTGGPEKEHGTNKPPPTGRVQETSKGDARCPSTSQNPPLWHPSWLSNACTTTQKDPESEGLAKDNLETNPITIKPETASHVTEQFSWVPLPSCSLPGHPFPIKALALSTHVSPQTVHFQVLYKSLLLGPGRVPFPATFLLFTGYELYSFATIQLEEYITSLGSVSCVSKLLNLVMGMPKFVASWSKV